MCSSDLELAGVLAEAGRPVFRAVASLRGGLAFFAVARVFFAPARRAGDFRPAVRFLLVSARFRTFPRALLAALRLAIAVVLSAPAYLDCFRVSVVTSYAYRRRKQPDIRAPLHTTRHAVVIDAVTDEGGQQTSRRYIRGGPVPATETGNQIQEDAQRNGECR